VVCFEVIFPDERRARVAAGADLVVNVTNDAWFGRSPTPRQRLAAAVFRAVQNHVWLVRAANSGIVGPSTGARAPLRRERRRRVPEPVTLRDAA